MDDLYLDNLSIEELKDLKKKIEDKLQKLKILKEKKSLEKEITELGYAFRKHHIECEFNYMVLEIAVGIYTWNKEDKDRKDWYLSDKSVQQKPWFKYLSYPDLNKFEIYDVTRTDDEWSYGDYDDPAKGIGYVEVYLYFKQSELPPEGKKIKVIIEDYEDGEPCTLYVKESVIYINEVPSFWNKENFGPFFVLPEN